MDDGNQSFLEMAHPAVNASTTSKTNASSMSLSSSLLPQKDISNRNNVAKIHWWNAPAPASLEMTKPMIGRVINEKKLQEGITDNNLKTTEIMTPSLPLQQNFRNNNKPNNQSPCKHPRLSKYITPSPPFIQNDSSTIGPSVSAYSGTLLDEKQSYQNRQLHEPKPCVGLLNADDEDEMVVSGYRRSCLRTMFCWFCICLTGGILRLVMHWWRHFYLLATHELCPLDEADKVLVQEHYQGKHKIYYVKKVEEINVVTMKERIKEEQKTKLAYYNRINSNNNKSNICLSAIDDTNLQLSMHFSSAQFKHNTTARIFKCKQLLYAWNNQTQSFCQLKGLDVNVTNAYFHQQKGLSAQEQFSRRLVYGLNEITVPYKDIKTLLFLEVLNPFYVFQIFSMILWFTYDYYYYACVIVLMSVFGISMSIMQTKKNQDALRDTVLNTGCALVINERGVVNETPTQFLVPGDIIEIPTYGCTMQCDAVLLSGNCILDESMLTGESVPVTKTPLPMKRDVIFDKKEHARHTLFCGTKVIQTRYIGSERVLAIVINTGNITAKGGLIRSILYPPPIDYKFEQDSYKFIECLGLIALVGFIYTLVTKVIRDVGTVKIAVESLDLITIVVPPALPAAMTVGRFYAQKRLERNNIYCISPRSINVAGSIDCCCFDKTGTLTEDGLDMWGVVPKSPTNQFQIPIKQIERLPYDSFLFGMVTCHSITIMNGNMMGDPLDLKMFTSTGWILEDAKDIPDSQKYGLIHPLTVRQPKKFENGQSKDGSVFVGVAPTTVQRQSSVDDLLADVGLLNGDSNNDHGIIREFPFTSNLQRMSVITRRLCEKHFTVYCKGSPEMLQQLCLPSSMPNNYSHQMAIFAKQGYRVIALAYKPLHNKINYMRVQRLNRESVESNLEFLGFVVLENRLKPDTTEVISSLSVANIRTIMVTGDNILTAVSVARDCGIVNSSQAVVTVNIRHLQQQHTQHTQSHNYELYYTLELGSKDECSPSIMANGNGNGKFPKDRVVFARTAFGNDDSSYRVFNGDMMSLDSGSVGEDDNNSNTVPNSSSFASIETCDTWTHHDVEIGLQKKSLPPTITTGNSQLAQLPNVTWRSNYRFAMVGNTWQIVREHFPEELRSFITRGAIFARMSPEQKQSLITELQKLDYCVAMCGDGANDCGALKVAHTGISLSETESSIASPFTSRNSTISCVPNVIKQGRAALTTSFGIFKYMAAYSMIQFISVMILYSIDSNLTDKQYLYIDLCLISVFAFFFGRTQAHVGPLVRQVPLSSLISLTPLASIILHLIVVITFQVAGWLQLHMEPWFVPFQFRDEDHLGCFENYTMFAISSFQYITLAFVFSKGAPYRRPIWSNIPFCITLVINLCFVTYLVAYPANEMATFFQLVMPPSMNFRYTMIIYGICIFIAHAAIETFIVETLLFKKLQVRRECRPSTSKRKYVHIEYDLQYCHTNWPQITETFETHDSLVDEDTNKPTYVEISAEQLNCEAHTTPPNNALSNFFEMADMTAASTVAADNYIDRVRSDQ